MNTRAKLARFFSETTGLRVVVRLHRNKTSWLSFKKDREALYLSLHEHFLESTPEVIEDVAAMLKGKKGLSAKSRAYLFSKEGQQPIETVQEPLGRHWNLQELYLEVENEYFPTLKTDLLENQTSNSLNLQITWFGEMAKKSRRITLGQYEASTRLIKIHRLLDADYIPRYFIHFIIYHEMLHSIYAPQAHQKGFLSIHPKEFRLKEREFKDYSTAQQWLKTHKQKLFF